MALMESLFDQSKQEVWRQLCAEMNAQYVEGSFWKGNKIVALHGAWTITLDTFLDSDVNDPCGSSDLEEPSGERDMVHSHSSTVYTRIRAPFVNPDGFYFSVCQKIVFSRLDNWIFGKLDKLLGVQRQEYQDIEIGDPAFDHNFSLRGSDETKLRELLGDSKIRELIKQVPNINLSVRDIEGVSSSESPDGVDELCCQVVGVVKDIEQLRLLFDLFSETLDQLCRIGAARESDPNISL